MVVEVAALGVRCDGREEHRFVAPALAALVAVVAEVQDGEEIERFDREVVARAGAGECRHDRLVHRVHEADVVAVAPETELPVRRPPRSRHERHAERDRAIGGLERGADRARIVGLHALVGVDVEDPVALRDVEGAVAGGGEVVTPRVELEDRAVRAGDVGCGVDRSGVDHHDLVDQAVQRFEATVEMLGFVAAR